MSRENVKKFYETLANDSTLQEKVSDLQLSEKVKETIEEMIVSIAKESGYDISIADLKEYTADLPSEGKDTWVSDWDTCFCVVGGGGYNRTENYSCACVIGGGGKRDRNGYYLFCPLAGGLGPA